MNTTQHESEMQQFKYKVHNIQKQGYINPDAHDIKKKSKSKLTAQPNPTSAVTSRHFRLLMVVLKFIAVLLMPIHGGFLCVGVLTPRTEVQNPHVTLCMNL